MNKTTYFLLGFISLFFFIYTIIWGIVGLDTAPKMTASTPIHDADGKIYSE